MHDPSFQHIQNPAPILAPVSLAQGHAALMATVVLSSSVILTADPLPTAAKFIPTVFGHANDHSW